MELRDPQGRALGANNGTPRAWKYGLEQAEREPDDLKRTVQQGREEIGNLEIIVDEEPEPMRLAIVEFGPEEGG